MAAARIPLTLRQPGVLLARDRSRRREPLAYPQLPSRSLVVSCDRDFASRQRGLPDASPRA
jgi:hypothetical protein